MLPKPEKTKKTSVNAQQLSLDDPIKKENHLKKKRLYVGLTLSLTVALSFSFSAYHYFKNNGVNFQLPIIFKNNNSSLNQFNIDKDISNLLLSDKNIWYISAQDLSTNFSFNWSQNKSNFAPSQESVLSELSNLNQIKANSHILDNVLPGGVTYVDNKVNSNSDLIYTSLLTVPKKQIFVYLKISNGTNSDQSLVNKKISEVVEKIYWDLINL